MNKVEFPTDASYDYTGTIALAFLVFMLLFIWAREAKRWKHKRV